MSAESPIDWIALGLLPGLGPLGRRRALQRFVDPGAIAFRVPAEELRAATRGSRVEADGLREARRDLRRRAEREWELCRRAGIRVVSCRDASYPAALEELPDAPVRLYVRGELREAIVRVAVVGSRTPSLYGKRVAAGLSGGLAERGIEVVSGGARGVDTCAHAGALEAEGRTIVVLGSGLLRPYPEENVPLFERVVERGAVLAEEPLLEAPRRENFPRRNRLISGLSAAVVVVEAAARSGSLGTAAQALEQGREVLAVPGPIHSARSIGCHRLIQQGAKLVQELEDVLEELPPLYRGAVAPRGATAGPPALDPSRLTADERVVLSLLDEVQPLHLDELVERGPLGISRLQAALFGLERSGAVEQTPGRYYLRRPSREP